MSWRRPSKTSSSILVILVESGPLESAILTYDTSLVAMKDRLCTVSCIPGSISVSWSFSAIFQHELPQYLRINIPPRFCVSLLESERSEDPIRVGVSLLSTGNNLTVAVLVTRCKHKQFCLTYRLVPSHTLQGRWCLLDS